MINAPANIVIRMNHSLLAVFLRQTILYYSLRRRNRGPNHEKSTLYTAPCPRGRRDSLDISDRNQLPHPIAARGRPGGGAGPAAPPLVWAALCIVSGGVVFAAELLNTALEHLADRLHPEQHPDIRAAKDCAAAAVLLASISALLIGLLTLVVGLRLLDNA
jgi:hypothetical protein